MFDTIREPTEQELAQVEEGYNEYYQYGDYFSLDELPVVIIENFAGGGYQGRLAVVVNGGANSTTYGFTEAGEAILISDALNEKRGTDTFGD